MSMSVQKSRVNRASIEPVDSPLHVFWLKVHLGSRQELDYLGQ